MKVKKSEKSQLMIGWILRSGVFLSALLVLTGGIIYLSTHSAEQPDFRTFSADREVYTSFKAILAGLKVFDGLAVIQFGVLVLIFTPILRIVFSVFSFFAERDYMYTLIGILVLCIIFTGLYFDLSH